MLNRRKFPTIPEIWRKFPKKAGDKFSGIFGSRLWFFSGIFGNFRLFSREFPVCVSQDTEDAQRKWLVTTKRGLGSFGWGSTFAARFCGAAHGQRIADELLLNGFKNNGHNEA